MKLIIITKIKYIYIYIYIFVLHYYNILANSKALNTCLIGIRRMIMELKYDASFIEEASSIDRLVRSCVCSPTSVVFNE